MSTSATEFGLSRRRFLVASGATGAALAVGVYPSSSAFADNHPDEVNGIREVAGRK